MVAGGSKASCLVLVLALGCGSESPGEKASAHEPSSNPTGAEAPPPISVAGQWGMFHFEDPVAVEITQDGTKLTGRGCDAGLPKGGDSASVAELYCSPLSGAVSGDSAWFEFVVPLSGPVFRFRAEVDVSKDSARMAGSFTDAGGARQLSSWLRLRDEQRHLTRLEGLPEDPLSKRYALRLIVPESPGSTYDPNRTYELSYAPGLGIHGDLGAFYYTEVTRPSDSAPIQVGPVPATGRGLPVRLELDHDARSVTRVTAVSRDGVVSVFDAVPAN